MLHYRADEIVAASEQGEMLGVENTLTESKNVKSENADAVFEINKGDSGIFAFSDESELLDTLSLNDWDNNPIEKRHSFDVTKLKGKDSDVGDYKMSLRMPASKSEEDVRNRCKKKRNYRKFSGAEHDGCAEQQGSDRKRYSTELRQTLARVLVKTVPDHIRSFMDLFTKPGDADPTCKDKQKNWRKAAQRRQRYKVSHRWLGGGGDEGEEGS